MGLFKYISRYNFQVIYPIIINYIIAFLFGLLISPPDFNLLVNDADRILPAAIFLGILFIVMFNFIGISSQKAGLTVTSVASRMSVIIPMGFAIIFYNEALSIVKWAGIILAIPAVIFTSLKNGKTDWTYLYLPIIIFFGSGMVDTTVVFSQNSILTSETQSSFTILVFGVAGVLGVLLAVIRRFDFRQFLRKDVFLSGFILGLLNYGALYYIISALKSDVFEDSIIFGINNIGVVLISVFLGVVFFKENLSKINIIGIFVSLLAILLLSLHN